MNNILAEISDSIIRGHNSTVNMNKIYETALISDIDNPDSCFRIPFNDFFLKYKSELDKTKITIDLESYWKSRNKNDSKVWSKWEQRYYYKPKFWLAVIRANNMKNIYEFHRPIIQVYNNTGLQRLFNIFKKREGRRK